MSLLLVYGGLCAVIPCLAGLLRPLAGSLTRTLVHVVAVAQVLTVPVLVALDPAISFGSDGYNLGAGVAILLIAAVEAVFVAGTAIGLVIALSYLRRRERMETASRS